MFLTTQREKPKGGREAIACEIYKKGSDEERANAKNI